MTILKALDRLSWLVNNTRAIRPQKSDKLALNTIIKHINDSRENAQTKNTGFIKLYIFAYAKILEQYNATVFDDIPQKQLHRLLDMPISYFVKRFQMQLNDSEQYTFLEELGFEFKETMRMNDEEWKEHEKAIKQKLTEEGQLERFTGRVWEYEAVHDNLLSQAVEAAIKFNK